jgi:hypothetical protein
MHRWILFLSVVTSVWASAANAQLQATATPSALSLKGATPRGRIAVCRVGNAHIDGFETALRQHGVVVAGADGSVTVPADVSALRSIWLAVDLKTGAYVVASPSGYTPRAIPPPTLTTQGPGASKTLRWSRPSVDVWVAGKSGIWHGVAAAGTPSEDGRSTDGSVAFNVNRLEKNDNDPDNHDPAPLVLTPGDVVFTADAGWMVYSVIVVPKGGGGAP